MSGADETVDSRKADVLLSSGLSGGDRFGSVGGLVIAQTTRRGPGPVDAIRSGVPGASPKLRLCGMIVMRVSENRACRTRDHAAGIGKCGCIGRGGRAHVGRHCGVG